MSHICIQTQFRELEIQKQMDGNIIRAKRSYSIHFEYLSDSKEKKTARRKGKIERKRRRTNNNNRNKSQFGS